jgi:hypothetical protein
MALIDIILKPFPVIAEIVSRKGILHFKRHLLFFVPFTGKKVKVCFHRFFQGDLDKHEHDHPNKFYSIVLYGGYIEQSYGKEIKRSPFDHKMIPAEYQHKVMQLLKKESWSLSIAWERSSEWGYITDKGWVDYKEYRKLKHAGTWDDKSHEQVRKEIYEWGIYNG